MTYHILSINNLVNKIKELYFLNKLEIEKKNEIEIVVCCVV